MFVCLLIANRHLQCEFEIRCLHYFQPVWHHRCFLSFKSQGGKKILHQRLLSPPETAMEASFFCVAILFLSISLSSAQSCLLPNSRIRSWNSYITNLPKEIKAIFSQSLDHHDVLQLKANKNYFRLLGINQKKWHTHHKTCITEMVFFFFAQQVSGINKNELGAKMRNQK